MALSTTNSSGVTWGAWDYTGGNTTQGMRVGIEYEWEAVAYNSTSVNLRAHIWTQNMFRMNDTQTLTMTGFENAAENAATNYLNNSGSDSTYPDAPKYRLARYYNYVYSNPPSANAYRTNTSTRTISASVSNVDAASGIAPSVTISNIAVPARPGIAPTAPGASSTPGDGSVSISYSAPAATNPPATPAITGYEYSSNNIDGWTATPSNPFSITNLTNGTGYTYYVRSTNVYYQSGGTAATSTPFGPPSAPTNISSSPNNGSITVSFGAPTSTNGKAITYYQYSTNNVNFTQLFSNPFDVPGTNGTALTVYVRAGNGDTVGTSAGSSVSTTSTPRTVPSAPTSFSANAATLGQITLSWAAPSSNGGSGVSSYVLRTGGTVLQNTSATSYTHTGLSPNTTYSYTVTAVNAAGEGAASSISATTIGGRVKIWDGSSWVTIFPQVWVESGGVGSWVTAQARVWNGTEWKFGL